MAPFGAPPERRTSLAPVAVAAGLGVAATLLGCLTWDGDSLVIPAAWLLAAVVGGSVFGGIAGGLTATLVGALALLLVFVDPRWSLDADDGTARGAAAFAAVSLLIALAIDAVDTARRRSDAALEDERSAVRLLDAVLAHAPIGIAFFDTDLRVVRANDELARFAGAFDDDLAGLAAEVLRTGRPRLDVHLRTDDPRRDAEASCYPVRTDDGTIVGVGAVVDDTTRAVAGAQEREALFERLTRLQTATATLAAARTFDDVVAAVVGVAATLALRDGDVIHVADATGGRWRRLPLDARDPLADAIRTGRVASARDDDDETVAAIPLRADGKVVGAIAVTTDGGRTWDDAERRFLEAIASQCGQALQRARLTDSERDARERLAFLADATAALAASLDLDDTLRRVADLAVPRLGDRCTVELVDGQHPTTDGGIPMVAGDRVVGALHLERDEGRPLAGDDLDLAGELAARAAQAVLNATLYRERAHVADVLQRSLLPPATAEVPGVDVATRFVPVGGVDVGGDFYDVVRVGHARRTSDTWAIVIGDVRGKGAEAATVTSAARNAIRAAALHTRSPAAMLAELNEVLLVLADERGDALEPVFCTAVVAAVTPNGSGARVVVGVGGHPLPMLLRADGTTAAVGEPGSLLGVVDDPLLQDVTFDVAPGEALVLYTDGVTERHSGDRFFDEDGLAATLSRCAGFTAEAVAERIELAARAFVEDALDDDLAVVVVRAPTRTATTASSSTDLPVDANAPRMARRFVTEVLGALGRDDLADAGALLASELVTNAVLHGEPPLRVSVEPGEGRVRVAVSDGGDGRPEVVDAPNDALHGRGMFLVEHVAARWGVDEAAGGTGKSVWFDLT